MPSEQIPNIPAAFQFVIGLLLSVIGFFLVSTFIKLDTVDMNVQRIMISNSGNEEWKRNIERRLNAVENNRERKEAGLTDTQWLHIQGPGVNHGGKYLTLKN